MSSLYKRATPRQAIVLRMIEGAVRNAVHAHPGRTIDDERMARSIAKRATGTLTAQWAAVLAAPRVWSDGSSGYFLDRSAAAGRSMVRRGRGNAVVGPSGHDRGGAPQRSWRAPVRALHRAIGHETGRAKRSGNTEREAALIDVLRLMARYVACEQMPDPRKRWSFEP
jgi:hypothetical protein